MEDNSVPKDVKSNFIKMVNYLKISTHILNVKENIVQSLEGEIEKLKQMVITYLLKPLILFNLI